MIFAKIIHIDKKKVGHIILGFCLGDVSDIFYLNRGVLFFTFHI